MMALGDIVGAADFAAPRVGLAHTPLLCSAERRASLGPEEWTGGWMDGRRRRIAKC